MWRFLMGAASALLLATAGILIWQAQADKPEPLAAAPPPASKGDAPLALGDLAPPPTATEKTREQKRFARYDKDKNGVVARNEYLLSRQKAFAKLDVNGDGRLQFEEYAVKTIGKFGAADSDRSGGLNATEFATTRVVRKARPRPKCLPVPKAPPPDEADEG